MKKLFILLSLIFSLNAFAQVGIGTTNPDASAALEVKSNSKGFLPPRVSLTSISDVSTISSPATGLMVYNTATAGTSPNNVTPGFYFFDGSKWMRIVNQQLDATIEFDKTTPTTSGVVFTPNTPQSKDYIYVSTVNGSQWTWNGSSYVTYTTPASTAWYISGGTNDAGSNKSSTIYRTGAVSIGTSNKADSSAQLDVNSSSKGFLPPRVALTATNAAGPINVPATGLLVYNTATAGTSPYNVTPGYYYNAGTSSAPNWSAIQTVTQTKGTDVGKIVYNKTSGTAGDISLSATVGQLTYTIDGFNNKIKLSSNPGSAVTINAYQVEQYSSSSYYGGGYALSYTTSNWSTYQTVGSMAVNEINTIYATCSNEDKAYKITTWIQGSGTRYNYCIIMERF